MFGQAVPWIRYSVSGKDERKERKRVERDGKR